MMTSCIGFRLRLFSLAARARQRARRRAASSGSTPRPTTAGGDRCCARASRCCGPGSAGHRGCPTSSSQLIEQRIVAFSLGHPGLGPRRISATLAQERWGGIVSQPQRRVAGAPPAWPVAAHQPPRPRRRLCRATGTRAADARSRPPRRGRPPGRAGRLRLLPRGPPGGHGRPGLAVHRHRPRHVLRVGRAAHDAAQPVGARTTSALARRVAADLAARAGASSGSSPTTAASSASPSSARRSRELGATQTFIRAGRPATNGAVERVQRTILEECWRPSFARSLVPKLDGPRRATSTAYLRYYNEERAHTGRLTQGRTPCQALVGARKMRPR